ncbi:MAG: YeeE/YedE family protein [Polyangiaceae bacterium]|nr:YeeE/YedE family protein [Polyangiaceae bacterium]
MKGWAVVLGLGFALGLALGFIGFGDFTEVHRMFTLQDARLYLTFAGAVGVTALGLRLFVRVPLESTRLHRSVPLGSVLFGVGWALCGACPGIGMVGVGQGALPVAVALGGMIVGIRAFDFVNARWLRWHSTPCGM